MTAAEYCRRHGLASSTLRYWNRRLEREAAAAGLDAAVRGGTGSVPIARVRRRASRADRDVKGMPGGALVVRVGSIAVEVVPGFDAATLSRVLDVLATRGAA